MMEKNYWTTVLSRRVSRRRTLAAAGSGALGAAFLAACGGDDNGGTTGDTGAEGGSGLAYQPVDTTSRAQKGGVLVGAFSNEPLNYDPLSSSSQFTFNHAHHAYQRFFSLKSGTVDEAASGEPEGDAVSGWEYSPDGLTLTMKLRPNTKFDERPPTSSRVMNTEDVKWSWDRFVALQPGSRFFMNNLNPD
jgi:peptide/nickel transport system substrate-binding protein